MCKLGNYSWTLFSWYTTSGPSSLSKNWDDAELRRKEAPVPSLPCSCIACPRIAEPVVASFSIWGQEHQEKEEDCLETSRLQSASIQTHTPSQGHTLHPGPWGQSNTCANQARQKIPNESLSCLVILLWCRWKCLSEREWMTTKKEFWTTATLGQSRRTVPDFAT